MGSPSLIESISLNEIVFKSSLDVFRIDVNNVYLIQLNLRLTLIFIFILFHFILLHIFICVYVQFNFTEAHICVLWIVVLTSRLQNIRVLLYLTIDLNDFHDDPT